MKKVTKFVNFCRGKDFSYCDPAIKREMHRLCRAALQELAAELGLQKGSFDVRSNIGGIAGSGEITLHGDAIYIQVQPDNLLPGEVMIRSCEGRKDYRGGRNMFHPLGDLLNFDKIADTAKLTITDVRHKHTV